MSLERARLCDRCKPRKTLAVGKPFDVKIGGFTLTYDVCKEHRSEMEANRSSALAALNSRAKSKGKARKTKTDRKKVAASRKRRRSPTKAVKRAARKAARVLSCRYGCGETFKGRSAGFERGQHERQKHGGAFKAKPEKVAA